MTTSINTKPPIGLLRHTTRAKEHEDVPVGSIVRTALGLEAEVIGYRGFRRGHRVWLVCRYLVPANKRFDKVQILPELVEIIAVGAAHG